MGTGCGFVPQVREIEALSSSTDIMAASPSVHFQTIKVFWKFESTTRCEEETFPELGLL